MEAQVAVDGVEEARGYYVLGYRSWDAEDYGRRVEEAVAMYRAEVARALAIGDADIAKWGPAVGEVRFAAARLLALGSHLPEIEGVEFTDGHLLGTPAHARGAGK